MKGNMNKGFTLIELLIVIAIIGILAAVLIPNLLRARQVAVDRAAESYIKNVYSAGQAYLAEDISASLGSGDCKSGVTFGSYVVAAPGAWVNTCSYAVGVNKVDINYANGTKTEASIGQ